MRRAVRHRIVALIAVGVSACGFSGLGTGDFTAVDGDAAALDAAGLDGAELDAATAGDTDINLGDGALVDAPVVDATADVIVPIINAGNALRFAANSYVEVGALAIPADFTFEAWIRPTAATGETYVMAKDRSGQGQGQCRFGLDDTRHLFFMLTDSGGNDHGLYDDDYLLVSPAPLALDTWAHVAVTKSGAAFALFVNGASVDTFNADAVFAHGGPAVTFRVGGRVGTDGASVSGPFRGTIDEVRVWSIARTQAQLAAAMKMPMPAATPSLIGSWRFEENAGTTTADGAGTHPGTLVGGPTWITSTAY